MTICLITSCAFVSPSGDWVAGDLFVTEDGAFIFNGNVKNGEAAWIEGTPSYSKQISSPRYWERRGVFVIENFYLHMNQAAKDYLKDSPFLP